MERLTQWDGSRTISLSNENKRAMSARVLKNLIPDSFPKSTIFVFVLQLSNGTKAFSESLILFTPTQLTK